MREMKDSGIGWVHDIPASWDVIKGKYLFTNNKLIVGSKVEEYDRLALTLNGVIKRSKDDNEGLQPVKFDTYQILKKDELVFKLIDLQNISTSRVGLSPYIGIVSPAYIILKCSEDIYPQFAEKYYLMMWMNQVFNALGDSGVRSSLNSSELLELSIPLPPIDEQKKIATYLDEQCKKIDEIMADIQNQIDTLEEYKKSVISEAVTKGLDPDAVMKDSGISHIDSIPSHWKTLKLKYASTLKGRIGWQGLRTEEYRDEGPYLVTGTDFNKGYINWSSCVHVSKERFEQDKNIQIQENDLLITKDGTIGKIAMAKECPAEVSLNSGVFIVRNNRKYRYNDKFFYYIILSKQFSLWFELAQRGNSTIKHLTQENFYEFTFAYPPIAEQAQIVDFLDDKCGRVDSIIEDKKAQLETIENYKKSLIYEYVTGKKEVPENE